MSFVQPILTDEEVKRYSRHLLLNEVGSKGQEKLLNSSVLIIGAGGLGSPVALYLAAAGVGTIGIIDGDKVDISNLQRQILYSTDDVGHSKVKKAVEKINKLNPGINVIPHEEYLTPENASRIIRSYDLVVNGSDNFSTRYLVNDCCVRLQKTLVDASAVMFEGQVAVYAPGKGCYRCLYPNPPQEDDTPTCSISGVFGALVGLLGSLQAMEAIKVLLNIGETFDSRLIYYDALSGEFKTLNRNKNPECPLCGDTKSNEPLTYSAKCKIKENVNENDKSKKSPIKKEVRALELNVLLRDDSFVVVDIRPEELYNRGHIEGSISIPYDELTDRIHELDTSKRIVLVCQFGKMSSVLQRELISKGYQAIWSLTGGMIEWERYNLPIIINTKR